MRTAIASPLAALTLAAWLAPHVAPASDDALPIVHLAFRDGIVTISSTADGVRYAVRTQSGELLGENLTDAELLAAHPQLHQQIHSGYAGSKPGSFIWAGRDESLIEAPRDATSTPE